MNAERAARLRIAKGVLHLLVEDFRCGNVSLSMKEDPHGVSFCFEGTAAPGREHRISALRQWLALPRRREMEVSYGTLSGGGEGAPEMALLGMMVDDARVEYSSENNQLLVELRRLI